MDGINNRLHSKIILQSQVLSLFALAVGLAGVLGWLFTHVFLYKAHLYLPDIKLNSALSIILLGVVTFFINHVYVISRYQKITLVLIVLPVSVIGSLTLLENIVDSSFGMGNIFNLSSKIPSGQSSLPGSVALLLLSSSVILKIIFKHKFVKLFQAAGFIALVISFLAIVGYLFDHKTLRVFYSAVAIFALSIAQLYAFPKEGVVAKYFSETLGAWFLRRLIFTTTAILLGLSFSVSHLKNKNSSNDSLSLELTLLLSVGVLLFIMLRVSKFLNSIEAERGRAFDLLNKTKIMYYDLYNQTPEMLLSVDYGSMRIIQCNETLLKKTQFTRNEIIGRNIIEMYEPSCRKKFADIITQFKSSGKIEAQELRVVKKDGSLIDVLLNSTAVRDADDLILYSQFSWYDLSAKKEIERALIREEAARQGSRLKSEFLATISHEIRTPLNGVIGMAGILFDTPLNSQQTECLDVIKKSSDILMALINNILDFSKIESGKLDLECVDFNIHEVVMNIKKEFLRQAKEKNIDLKIVGLDSIPKFVKGDPIRLRQVLINLFSNAIKFTQKGEIAFTLCLLKEVGNELELKFEVSDTGIGISKDVLGKLFQPFFQGDSSTTRIYGGSGLGLSICEKIVHLMGGKISATSRLNEGSQFSFTLCMQKGEPILTLAENSLFPKLREEWGKALRVLVVEDSLTNQKVITIFLKKLNYVVEVAGNGREALEFLKVQDFDLILMDCYMPELDGYQTTQIIRSSSARYSQIPIFALTANTLSEHREKCLEVGMDDYFSKPIDFNELQEKLISLKTLINPKIGEFEEASPSHVIDSIDWSIINEFQKFDGSENSGTLKELINIFSSNAPAKIESLQKLLADKEPILLKREAHALKSSSSYIGARRLGIICDQIEKAADSLKFEEIELHLDHLKSEYDKILQILNSKIHNI